uniref:Uncharacterized protein n=1 Tax=Bionectria ochroleuca TaxID=29856 RepID=A0A8H7N1W9_BIOOC
MLGELDSFIIESFSSVEFGSTALLASSSFTTADPFPAPHNSGIQPYGPIRVLEVWVDSPLSRSSRITTFFLFATARDNGVQPYLSLEFGSTASSASSSFTTFLCPFSAAIDNGV